METTQLKNFATWARTQLIAEISSRITAVLASGSAERAESPTIVASLERAIAAAGGGDTGASVVTEKVAYTWFNRIVALRFMDANGYTGIGVVSPSIDQIGQPEVLAAAKRGQIDSAVVSEKQQEKIFALLDGTRQARLGFEAQAEAYATLLTAYCWHWNKNMPFMFDAEGNYTELLIPTNILAETSVLNKAVEVLTPKACEDVEVIGWLYQFYISERKDEVFAGFKKNKKAGAAEIPPATQLFTPHWIVRYLVENSVGRLWMLNHPESTLIEQMKYYIEPVDEQTEFLRIESPQELTVIDPACGSGHMLTYAFDLLYAIYEEEGYTPSEIPGLILTHNLFGTEIDQRAGALAAFALTMKAVSKRKLFLKKPVKPNICVLEPITFSADEVKQLLTKGGDAKKETEFWNLFEHADIFGSLIRPNKELTSKLSEHINAVHDGGDLFKANALDRAKKLIKQAQYLVHEYSVVVANPPYMGGKQMGADLSQFMKKEYPTGKADLMAAFMIRSQELTELGGSWAMINLPSWMSLKSFEAMRNELIAKQQIACLVHLGRGIFGSDFGTVAFVMNNVLPGNFKAIYRRLFEEHVEVRSISVIESLFLKADYNRFETPQKDLTSIPGSPIVYWLSEKVRKAFSNGVSLSHAASLKQGLATGCNDLFLRHWWETSMNNINFTASGRDDSVKSKARWFPYNKGGKFRRWYGNQEFIVDWQNDGEKIRKYGLEETGKLLSRPQNMQTYFSPSVSWSDVSSGDPSFRHFQSGFIHDVKGMSAFADSATLEKLGLILNSNFAKQILNAVAPTLNFQVGDVGKLPIAESKDTLPAYTRDLVATAKIDWDSFETSWLFTKNPLVQSALHDIN